MGEIAEEISTNLRSRGEKLHDHHFSFEDVVIEVSVELWESLSRQFHVGKREMGIS